MYVARSCMNVCVCVCVGVHVYDVHARIYIRALVCDVWVLPLLHVHSPYDTTMTRLSRLEKGSGAREAPATQ